VCCETFDKRTHFKITCGFCDHQCCRECVQTYILSRPEIPSCMNCNHEWNNQFLINSFTKSFMNKEYKKHREQFLFEREQIRLPEAQQLIQVRRSRDEARAEADKLKELYMEKMDEFHALNYRFGSRNVDGLGLGGGYTRRCPADGCRGFLSKQWKCGVCDKHVCSQCHEIKTDGHECNPDNVATAQLIKKDSKPCPRCGIYIHKLEGCNQMWCTDCHTAFDWRSGAIITGNIHNPHFFEARRAAGMQARNVNDIPCGGMPSHSEFKHKGYESDLVFPRLVIGIVCNIQGLIVNANEPNNMDNRLLFLEGNITEEQFRSRIRAADKKYHKQRELDDIYQMAATTVSDILRQLITDGSGMNDHTAEKQIVDILNYANEALADVGNKYNSRVDNSIFFKYFTYKKIYLPDTRLYYTYDVRRKDPGFKFEVGKTFVPPEGYTRAYSSNYI